MNLDDAYAEAANLLDKILTSQPALLTSEHGHGRTNGAAIAQFCSHFIETYVAYLVKRRSSDSVHD